MKNNLILIQKINATRLINEILYYLQKIPFLGKHIPNSCFKLTVLKDISCVVSIIFKCISSLFNKFILIGVLNILPALLFQEYRLLDFSVIFIICYILTFVFVFPLYQSKIINSSHQLTLFYHMFHMHPKTILWEKSLFDYGCLFIGHLIILTGCSVSTSLPFYIACTLSILHLCSYFIYEEILIRYLNKYHEILIHKLWLHILVLSIISIVITLLFLQPSIFFFKSTKIIFWISAIYVIVRSYFSFQYLNKKVNYQQIVIYIESAFSNIVEKFITKNEKKYKVEKKEQPLSFSSTSSKQHLYFLNDLFFKRHTALIQRPFIQRLKICSSLFLICLCISFFFIKKLEISVVQFIPMFFLPMYLCNISEPINHALFHNCDKYLLHYQIYRQKDIILKNFVIRLLYLLKYNLLLTTILCIYSSIIIFLLESNFNFINYVAIWGSLYTFCIFFTIHHLFLYYIFQPYSIDEEINSPIYFILQSIVVMIALQLLQIKANLLFCILLLSTTILYCIISIICIYKFSFKTFKIK